MNDKDKLEVAAEILGVKADSLRNFSKATQELMEQQVDTQDLGASYEELKEIWQTEVLNRDLIDVAKFSGMSIQLLKALPNSVKADLIFSLASEQSVQELHNIVNRYLDTAALPDIAVMLRVEIDQLRALPYQVQKHLCGMFEMEYGITEDNELVSELREVMAQVG